MTDALPRLRTALLHQGTGPVAFHRHGEVELIAVIEGEVRVSCDGEDRCARPGSAFVIPARGSHDQRSAPGRWRTLCVLYTPTDDLLPTAPRVVTLDARCERWLEDLVALTGEREPSAGDGVLYALLARLAAREQRTSSEAALPPPLATALRFLAARLADTLADEDVARAAGVSVSHLGALFRARFGCGPMHHLQRLRMDHAAHLLRNPYAPLAEVARACGYGDSDYFIRHFKRRHGVTPGRFRAASG